MNSKEYNNSIIDWIGGIIKEKYVLRKSEYETFETFLFLNSYFITFEFDQNTINQKYIQSEDRAPVGSIELRQVSNIYNMMCRENFGRNYNKISDEKKPLAVTCIDANGSRYWSELGDIENVHIHSIWIMDAEEKSCFDIAVSKAIGKSSFDVKALDIQRYTGDIEKVISYTFKFDKFARGSVDIQSTFSIFPKRT